MRMVVALVCLCMLVIIVGGCGLYPRLVDVVEVDAVCAQRSYDDNISRGPEYSITLTAPVTTGVRTVSVLSVSENQYRHIRVDQPYHLTIEIWSNGWGPYAKLRDYCSLEKGSQ